MTPDVARPAHRQRVALAVALILQAAILLPRLSSLPVWADEQQTIDLVRAPLADVFEALRHDFHPPLYFVVMKGWSALTPWAGTVVDRCRLASVIAALAATVALDRLWLRDVSTRARMLCLALWVTSPCLLLYARMARSYTLQVLIGVVALRAAVDWIDRRDRRSAILFGSAETIALYVHYLPGLAIGAGAAIAAVLRSREAGSRPRFALTAFGIPALAFLPWSPVLISAVSNRLSHDAARALASAAVGQPIRLAFTAASFFFGETQPMAAIAVSLLVLPLALWLVASSAIDRRQPRTVLIVVAASAVVAWVIASWHVVASMMPSRMLFVLPFAVLFLARAIDRHARRAVFAAAIILVLSCVATVSYFQQRHFLTKAYLIPSDTIADDVERFAAASKGIHLLLVDAINVDATAVVAAAPSSTRVEILDGATLPGRVTEMVNDPRVSSVSLFRRSYDGSSAHAVDLADEELSSRLVRAQARGHVRYDEVDRLIMRALGWRTRPEYFVEVEHYVRTTGDAAP